MGVGFVFRIIVAIVAAYVIFRVGLAVLRALATPPPEPPPAGELRKVKLTYRCTVCGSELRMTLANDEVPAPPHHCMQEMEAVATPEL